MVILNGIYDRNWLGLAKRQDEAGIISKLLVLTLPALQAGISAIPIVLRSVTGQLILVNFTCKSTRSCNVLFTLNESSSLCSFDELLPYIQHHRRIRETPPLAQGRAQSSGRIRLWLTGIHHTVNSEAISDGPFLLLSLHRDLRCALVCSQISHVTHLKHLLNSLLLHSSCSICWALYKYQMYRYAQQTGRLPSPDFNPSNDVGYTLHRIPGVSPGLVAFLVFGTTASCRKRYREMFSGLCLWREQSAKTPDPMRRPSAPGWAAPADWGEKEQPERPELPVCPTRLGVLDDVEEYEMQVAHIERKKSHVAGRQDSVSVVHFACPKCVVEGISPV